MASDPTEPIECAAIFVLRDVEASLAHWILKAPAGHPYGTFGGSET